jgi:hypothetical protein
MGLGIQHTQIRQRAHIARIELQNLGETSLGRGIIARIERLHRRLKCLPCVSVSGENSRARTTAEARSFIKRSSSVYKKKLAGPTVSGSGRIGANLEVELTSELQLTRIACAGDLAGGAGIRTRERRSRRRRGQSHC